MNEIFDTDTRFADLGLRDTVLRGVETSGFSHPTHIQKQLIPAALAGRDVLGQAKTGTGKTAAFGLPILHMSDPKIPMQALVLTPTRELAVQVAAELQELGRFTNIQSACIIGGESVRNQTKAVERGAHILVGTPGRVMDLQSRGALRFGQLRFVVLDEVDRMLDIGFREDIRRILKNVPNNRQTIFVSATISPEIERLGRQHMKPDAHKIEVAASSLTVSLVEQWYLPVEPWDKRTLLLHILRKEKPEMAVVFCRTKATVHRVTKYLCDKQINAREIHGDLIQRKRNRVMESLRQGTLDVLVASDLAARGLDVEHISHVINYDLPEDPEVYVHRIGRTARAGRRGVAWSFACPDQGQLLTEIEKLTGALIDRLDYPSFKPGPVPADAPRRAKPPTPVDPGVRLAQRADGGDAKELSDQQLKQMFPNGVAPKGGTPKRTLGSRFRTRRSR